VLFACVIRVCCSQILLSTLFSRTLPRVGGHMSERRRATVAGGRTAPMDATWLAEQGVRRGETGVRRGKTGECWGNVDEYRGKSCNCRGNTGTSQRQAGHPILTLGCRKGTRRRVQRRSYLLSHLNGTRMIDGDDAGRFILSKVSLEKN
jgi:hypothetical protein